MTSFSGKDERKHPDGLAGFERETDYRLAAFISASKQFAGKRIALYGSGANAVHIFEAEGRCFDIVAIADDSAIGKTVGSLVVTSLEDALSQGIDELVIAAEFASASVVYYRICGRCREAGVRMFDMYGNDWADVEAAISRALGQSIDAQLEIIESCSSLCVNVGLFIDGPSATTIPRCVRYQGDLAECLSAVINYALARGKTVAYYCIDSEMDERTVLSVLEQAGLTDVKLLFLAADTGLFAENGLYRLMYGHLPSGETVHIGMDVFRDCLIPLCYGRCSVLTGYLEMPNSIRLVGLEGEAKPIGAWHENEAIGVEGESDARLLACARAVLPEIADAVGASASQVVGIVAPLAIGFVTWLVNRFAQLPGTHDEVLFASRDGFLVKKVYDVFLAERGGNPFPPSRYFYTSRKSSRAAVLSKVERDGALRYLASCGFSLGKTYAFVEFVGAGTCQRQLERFVPFRLEGFYFGSRIGDVISRKLASSLYFDERHVSFFSRYLVLEPYLSSTEPSLVGFDDGGEPVFDLEFRTPEELKILEDVHEGVVTFARSYFEHWYEEGDVVSPSYLDAIMPYLDLCDTDCMKLVDDLSGRVLTKQVGEPMPSSALSMVTATWINKAGESESRKSNRPEGQDCTPEMLELLAAFDIVCDEFDLTYVATHGALLGAVREGGFVPGDDDIDVAMPRTDYDRLLELAEWGVFPEPFTLQTPENDDEHFTGGFAKLRNLTVAVKRSKTSGHPYEEGVWIDILPLDNCPLDDGEVEKRQRIVRSWQRLLYVKTYGSIGSIWDSDPRKLSAYFLLSGLFSRETLCRRLSSSCQAVKPTGLLTCFAANYRSRTNSVRYSEADIAQAVRVPFENTTIPIPRNAEGWLNGYYGPSWREAPDNGNEGA